MLCQARVVGEEPTFRVAINRPATWAKPNKLGYPLRDHRLLALFTGVLNRSAGNLFPRGLSAEFHLTER